MYSCLIYIYDIMNKVLRVNSVTGDQMIRCYEASHWDGDVQRASSEGRRELWWG